MTSATTTSPALAHDSPLARALAQVLPKDLHFTAWHLSTTPATTEALCYPPALNSSTTEKRPSKPLKTYCEKHFLALSITEPASAQDVLVLGLEIYIYTTAFSTIIFVSKADSTGYLHLQPAPQGFSPIQAVTVAFLDFLVEHRRRPSKQIIINLFARAQSQYLFPGSVKNSQKHILDDRGLIKWWCKVLNAVLEHGCQDKSSRNWEHPQGYLVVPGLDNRETRVFIPRTEDAQRNWILGDPLELISSYKQDPVRYGNVPLRCLIPTYPDDPKSRFVEELEESTSEKAKLMSGWKVPATLDQFWEMMAFRQECSSGRMTSFFWVVFEPRQVSTSPQEQASSVTSPNSNTIHDTTTSSAGTLNHNDSPTEPRNKSTDKLGASASSTSKLISASSKYPRRKRRAKKLLKGPIITRKPRVKTHHSKYPDEVVTPYYYWPKIGRGQVVLEDNSYTRAVELLLYLEFKGLEQAVASTSKWISEVNVGENWALPVIGERVMPIQSSSGSSGVVNDLAGSVIRKRKSGEESAKDNTPMVNEVLIRKKVKVDTDEKSTDGHVANTAANVPTVNVLGSGFIRKKTKEN